MQEYFKNQLKEKKKQVIKWTVIWIGTALGSIPCFALFMQLIGRKIAPPNNLPWWIFIPIIIALTPAVPLMKKAWEYDKFKNSQKLHS